MIQNIVKYQIVLPGGKENKVNRAVGFIHGWDDKKIHRLTCHFHAENKPILENSVSTGTIHLHYPINIFGTILNVIRNESPILVMYDEITSEGQIMTEHETVGKCDTEDDVETSNLIYRKIKN